MSLINLASLISHGADLLPNRRTSWRHHLQQSMYCFDLSYLIVRSSMKAPKPHTDFVSNTKTSIGTKLSFV